MALKLDKSLQMTSETNLTIKGKARLLMEKLKFGHKKTHQGLFSFIKYYHVTQTTKFS